MLYSILGIATMIASVKNLGFALAFVNPRSTSLQRFINQNGFGVHSDRAQALSWRLFPGNWTFNWKGYWRDRQKSERKRRFVDDNNYSRTPFADSVSDTSLTTIDYSQFPLAFLSDENRYQEVIDNCGSRALEMKTSDVIPKHIRLQIQLDPDIDILDTKRCLLRKMSEVRSLQCTSCLSNSKPNPELYPRTWIKSVNTESLNKRKKQSQDINDSFLTVMQFNLLAEGLSEGQNRLVPFDTKTMTSDNIKNTYGGFTKVQNPDKCLAFKNRKWRLLETILSLPNEEDTDERKLFNNDNPHAFYGPDLLCVEEIDRFYDFFQPALSRFGYQGIFQPKPKAPGVKLGWYSDGCAIFFKKDVFELISYDQKEFRKGTQIYIVATLKHLESGRMVVVGVTHLKAGQRDENELVREKQAQEFLEEVEKAAIRVHSMEDEEISLSNMKETLSTPILLVGDFNAEPCSLNKERELSWDNLPCSLTNYSSSLSSLSGPSLKSAYPNEDNDYTTWKARGETSVKHVIDYILYSSVSRSSKPSSDDTFSCTKILNIPEEEEVEEGLYPGFRHPSDHINIAAQFSIRKKN